MKKFFYFAALFAAGLAASGCSNDNDEVTQEGPQLDELGNGYVSIAINLPVGDDMTRANGDFGSGDDDEHAVNDVIMVLFDNASDDESTATFHSAYNLTPTSSWTTGSGEVTKYRAYTQKLNGSFAANVYALIILNGNIKDASAAHKLFEVEGTGLKVNGTSLSAGTSTFGSAVKGAILDNIGSLGTGFIMATAPYSIKAGKTNNPSTEGAVYHLNKITGHIKSTEALAAANPANIYVERAAAKVTLTPTAVSGTVTDGSGLTYSAMYWKMDNYNTSYFATRHFDGTSTINSAGKGWLSVNRSGDYRFVEASDYEGVVPASSAIKMYRTTWGEDINYKEASGYALSDHPLTTVAGVRLATSAMTALTALTPSTEYVAENTMDDDHMTWNQTTRAIVAVQFNSGADFWTTSATGTNLLTESTATKTSDLTTPWVTTNTTVLDAVYTTWRDAYIILSKRNDVDNYTRTYTYNTTGADIGTLTCTFSTAITVSDLEVGKTVEEATAALTKALTNAIESNTDGLGLKYFKDGLAYYSIRIQHFGVSETPWTGSGTAYATVYGDDNDTRTNNYLGRYGILRNNWYQLAVTSVRSLGEPNVPEIPDTPDDIGESYLGVKINILKWGIRSMSDIAL